MDADYIAHTKVEKLKTAIVKNMQVILRRL